jgi:hypothetical protein
MSQGRAAVSRRRQKFKKRNPTRIRGFSGGSTSGGLPSGGTAGEILQYTTLGTLEWIAPVQVLGTSILSNPPVGNLRVTNVYVDSVTGNTVIEYDDDIVSSTVTSLVSNPPSGHYKVLNIYVDPNNHKTVVDYENTPQP